MLGHMAAQIAALDLTAQGQTLGGPAGHDAPWGVFACAGQDEWCAVTARGDADWAALCAAIGRADLAADPALATAEGRAAQRARIDQALEAWLTQRTPLEAMTKLQARGVPAGAMLRVSELPDFSYFRQRDSFDHLSQPHFPEPLIVDNGPVRAAGLARPPLAPAPTFGEHTLAIARDLLGLAEAEIAALTAAGVLEFPPPAAPSAKS
jgi:crotonobetainyl-CoA:carnitine CoA-transferase CaiB-like acyl-CoA transferase